MRFIDPAGKVLAHLDRVLAWQRGDAAAPVTVEWDLSNRCVLGCQDCHFAHTHVRGPWVARDRRLPMAYDTTGDLADLGLVERVVAEMGRAGVQGIVWSGGGEPTTHPGWQDAMLMAAERGLAQGMYTLGGLLTQTSAVWLAHHAAWVVVSLDAADAATYAAEKGVPAERFTAACDGIRWLAAAQATVVGVSFLLHADNWRRAGDMLQLARALGATYTTFRPAIRTSPDRPAVCADDRGWILKALEHLEALRTQPDVEISVDRFVDYADWQGHGYASCEAIRLNTTVTPDGLVWVCPQRRGVTAIGDLRVESFADVWARHPRAVSVDAGCRVMCRLHAINEQLVALRAPRAHEAFV